MEEPRASRWERTGRRPGRSGDVLRRLAPAVLTALACTAPVVAQQTSEQFVHRSWSLRDGLPQSSIYAIEQTRDGYLWIGTLQGLVRFDGRRFTTFDASSTPGLNGNRIVSLVETADGALWIGTQAQGVSRYIEGEFESYTIEDGLPSNAGGPSGHIAPSTDDRSVWAVTDRGLARFVPGPGGTRGRFEVLAPPTGGGFVSTVHEEADGTLWVGTGRGLLGRMPSSSEWLELSVDDGIADGTVGSVLRAHDGTLWVGTNSGISRLAPGSTRFDSYPVSGDLVFSILEASDGTIWAASPGEGLLRFEGGRFVPYESNEGKIGLSAVDLFEDREGHIWVGTNGNGLHRLKRSLFSNFGAAPPGAPGPMTHGTLESHDGDVWAATYSSGLMRVSPDGSSRRYGVEDGLPSPTVWAVAETPGNILWVGTESGLVRYNPRSDRFEPVKVPGAPVLETRRVASLALGARGELLAGTFLTHLVAVTPAAGETLLSDMLLTPDMLPRGGGILSILTTADGALWIGTQNAGIVRMQGEEIMYFGAEQGLPAGAIRTLVERPDGSIWVGTYGSGVCALPSAQDRFTCLSMPMGLPGNTVHAIEEDALGFVWMASNQGLFRVKATEMSAFFRGEIPGVRSDVFSAADGLPNTEFNGGFQPTSWTTRDGRLLFPSANGVAVVDPQHVDNRVAGTPIMRVETLSSDDRTYEGSGPFEVRAGSNRLTLTYTGIHFGNPDALRFHFRLDGYDPDLTWIEGGEDRSAVYTSLPPGKYNFRVRGALGGGEWEEASLAFEMPPLLYQTLWFRGLVALAIATLISLAAATASRQRFRRELARVEGVRALEAERSRISRDMHDEVGASLTEIAILSEIARRELDQPANAGERLERIALTSRGMLDSLGQIVWAINPKNDGLPTLAAYMREHAARYLDVADVTAKLDFPTQVPDLLVTAEVRRNIFVILKEALHNVVKHSDASMVEVIVRVDNERLSMVVRDDGRGFESVSSPGDDTNRVRRVFGGDGLGNMQRRASDIGGELSITSQPNNGTTVTLVVPLSGPMLGH